MFIGLVVIVLSHWSFYKCPLLLTASNNMCVCFDAGYLWVETEYGSPQQWLKILSVKHKFRFVREIIDVPSNTKLIMDVNKGDVFVQDVTNKSWFNSGKEVLFKVNDPLNCKVW